MGDVERPAAPDRLWAAQNAPPRWRVPVPAAIWQPGAGAVSAGLTVTVRALKPCQVIPGVQRHFGKIPAADLEPEIPT